MRAAGYTVTGTGNAPTPAKETTVTYPSGLKEQAKALAARLRTPATPRWDPQATPGAVTLTVGSGYPGLRGGLPGTTALQIRLRHGRPWQPSVTSTVL
ncbi:LytR C-terminal domain-containing protein [Streptomyces viridosporus]